MEEKEKERKYEESLIEKCMLLDTKPDADYDSVQLERGITVEREHTRSDIIAKIITKHHIIEFHNYYDGLDLAEELLKGNLNLTILDEKTNKRTALQGKNCTFKDSKNIICKNVEIKEE